MLVSSGESGVDYILGEMSDERNRWLEAKIFVYEGPLRRFIARHVSRDDRDDVLQEVYEKVLKVARLRPIAHPFAYLRTVVHSVLTDRARRLARRKGYQEEELREEHYPVDRLSPEERLLALEELAQVKDCLDLLPPRAQQAVWLHRHLGCSQRETALRMGITEGAVEQTLVAGMRQLKDCCRSKRSEAQSTRETSD